LDQNTEILIFQF